MAPSSEDLPFAGAALHLPTRFVVKVPHDVAAQVTVTLVGADAAGQPIHQTGSVTSVPHQDVNLNLLVSGLAVGGGGPPTDMGDDGGTGGLGPANTDGGTDMATDPCAGCAAPKLCCNSRCVDPSSDPNNCGGCNVVCGSGLCGAALSAPMTDGTRPTSWSFNASPNAAGGALYDSSAKLAVLTTDTSNQSGSIVYHDSIVADAFDAHFDFRMSSAGAHADGAGFLLIKDDGSAAIYTATGLSGSGLGFVSPVPLNGTGTLNGYAVELDSYDNDSVNGACGESINGDHVNIDTFSPCSTVGGTVPTPLATPKAFTLVDGNWHTAHVTLSSGKLSVGITQGGTETTLFSNVTLTGFKSGDRYYFGFAGATGQFSERAELRNISVTFPTARCL